MSKLYFYLQNLLSDSLNDYPLYTFISSKSFILVSCIMFKYIPQSRCTSKKNNLVNEEIKIKESMNEKSGQFPEKNHIDSGTLDFGKEVDYVFENILLKRQSMSSQTLQFVQEFC